MKQTIAALVAGIALTGLALSASAQTFSNEVSVFGSWEDTRAPVDIDQTNVYARYGRVIAPQVVGTVGLQRSRFKATGVDSTTTALTVGAKYYITPTTTRAIVPFVDASIGVANTDSGADDGTDFTWEFGGGVSWFFTPATSFDAGLRFFHTSTDVTTKGTRLFVGVTTRF
jgi:outer membrane protein with beta-barrel domain